MKNLICCKSPLRLQRKVADAELYKNPDDQKNESFKQNINLNSQTPLEILHRIVLIFLFLIEKRFLSVNHMQKDQELLVISKSLKMSAPTLKQQYSSSVQKLTH